MSHPLLHSHGGEPAVPAETRTRKDQGMIIWEQKCNLGVVSQAPSQPSLRARILSRGLFAGSLKALWEGLTMALLMKEPVANSEQSHERGEKLDEDRERADEPTTA